MKTIWSYSRAMLPIVLFTLLSVFTGNAQTLPFRLSKGSGTFRLGVVCGNESRWLDECRIKGKGQTYTIKDKLWKDGEIKLTICPLSDSEGFIMEVSGDKMPENVQLCWAFGACDDTRKDPATDGSIPSAACHDNVFNVEGSAFTVYYGEVMKLRTVHGVVPPASDIRLCDAYKQETPLSLFHSGKQTDAPVISALCPWKPLEKTYFCLYKQNAQADYNEFMLPALFQKEQKR